MRLFTSICLGTRTTRLLFDNPKSFALLESTMLSAAPVSTANQAGRLLTRTATKRWLPVLRLSVIPEVGGSCWLAFTLGKAEDAAETIQLTVKIRSLLNC